MFISIYSVLFLFKLKDNWCEDFNISAQLAPIIRFRVKDKNQNFVYWFSRQANKASSPGRLT